jgi:hypothetical protein
MMLNERSPELWRDPAFLADLNGGFIVTERSNNDLLLTFDFGGGAASVLTLDDFFSRHSGPGFGAETTPAGILDDEAAVPILTALFRGTDLRSNILLA